MNENSQKTQQALSVIQLPPEEAANNIDKANLLDMQPDAYKDMKPHLEKEVNIINRVPANLSDKTAEFATRSEQHASLVQDDLPIMDSLERRASWYKRKVFEIPEINRELAELRNKQITEGKLSEGELETVNEMNALIAEYESQRPKEVGDVEAFITEGVSAVGDIFRAYGDNMEVIAGATALGAGAGAVAGSFVFPALGTLVGAKAGAIKGLAAATPIVMGLDAYKQTRGLMYNSLSNLRDDKGNPIKLSHDKMANVSIATAMVAGGAGLAAGKVLSSNNPLLKRFATPSLASKAIAKSPQLLAKMDLIGGLIKSAVAEGSEEGLQEFIQIVGENFAQLDDTEESFMNTISNIGESIKDSFTSETGLQVGRAALLGGFAGGTLTGASSIISRSGVEERISQVQQVEQKRKEVLELQNMLLEAGEEVKQTKFDQLAPNEMNNFLKKVFGSGEAWITTSDLVQFVESNPDVAKSVENLGIFEKRINSLGNELNYPTAIPLADAVQIVKEVPEFSDLLRASADGESAVEARTNAQEYAQRLNDANLQRQALLESFGDDQELTEEVAIQLDELRQKVKDPRPYENELDYISSVSFVEVEGIMSKEEAETFNTANLDARRAVSKSLNDDNELKFDRHENRIFKDVDAKDIQVSLKEIESDLNIVGRYADTKNLSEAALATTRKHKKKGFSPNAIDPKSLPEDLKAIYADDPKLRKRKVFVEGGITVEEAAALNGVESGEKLLEILAETPDKKELLQARKQRKLELKRRIRQDIRQAKLLDRDKNFSKLTKVYLREMQHMVTKQWPTTKRGLIKIAKKVPTVKELNIKAKDMVRNMTIAEVNPKAFEVGERVSQNQAVKDFVDGKFEQSLLNKEKAALNNELRKESLNAKDSIEKNKNFWKKVLTNKSIKRELKEAGYDKVMDDFTALYRLDGNNKGVKEKNAYTNFLKEQAQLGNWVPEIPERLADTRASINELTVQQYQELTDTARFIIDKAKRFNKVTKARANRIEQETAERLAAEIEEKAQQHFNYDQNRNEDVEFRNLSASDRFKGALETAVSTVSNVKTIALELDEQMFGGYFHNLLVVPVKEAITNKRTEIKEIATADEKIMREFYKGDEFERLMNTFIEVPEFKDMKQLGLRDGKGSIRKSDLMVMFAYMGDPDGRKALENFQTSDGRRLTIEEIQAVLDRELSENDALFAHNFLVKRWERFTERSKEMHKRTTGTDVELVEGVEFTHRGKVFEGGYYPIKRNRIANDTKAAEAFASLTEQGKELAQFGKNITNESEMFAKLRSAEMTFQGRLKERTGSERTLNLNFENFRQFTEEMVHDLHLREPSANALKILKDKDNVSNITAVIGQKKYGVLLNSFKDIASKTSDKETALFSEQNEVLNEVINKAHKFHAVQVIAWNPKSMGMQALSLGNVIMRHGPKAGVYLAKNAARILKNPTQYEMYAELANKLNADIQLEQDGIDDVITKGPYDWMPASNNFSKNYKNLSAQGGNRIKKVTQKWLGDYGFVGLRELDRANRIVTTLGVAEQLINGDIKGYDVERVQAMSEAELAKTVQILVQQTSDTSLTANSIADKTPIEKQKAVSQFVRYFVDRRAGLNTLFGQAQKVKRDFSRKEYSNATGTVLTTMLVMGAMKGWVNVIREDEESIVKQLKDAEDGQDYIDILGESMQSVVTAPITEGAGYIPFLDNMAYQVGLDSRRSKRTVSTPLTAVMSEGVEATIALRDMLSAMVEDGPLDSLDSVDREGRRAILNTLGYISGGAPTNAIYRAYEFFEEEIPTEEVVGTAVKELSQLIDKYAEQNKDKPEMETFVNDLKELQKTLPADNETAKLLIPENAQEDMKTILSEGDWKKVDEVTGATGVYQFTEERWDEIRSLNPDLGLTENGRVSKNSEQQEEAMKWNLENNAQGFKAYGIPVTTENLLGAHEFGFDIFTAIVDSPNATSLSKILGDEANSPEFKRFKTVKSVKDYLKRRVNKLSN